MSTIIFSKIIVSLIIRKRSNYVNWNCIFHLKIKLTSQWAGRRMSKHETGKIIWKSIASITIQKLNGRIIAKFQTTFIEEHIFRLHMNMENLFNNKALSDNMNAIFNENYQLIFKEVQKPVEESFEKILRDIIQPVFDKFPYNELFAE